MTTVPNNSNRSPWTKPEIRRISAGSAEAGSKTGTADGTSNSNGKIYS